MIPSYHSQNGCQEDKHDMSVETSGDMLIIRPGRQSQNSKMDVDSHKIPMGLTGKEIV